MILVDTSVWIDHFGKTDELLSSLLVHGSILMHDFVLGELAMGSLPRRSAVLFRLEKLPRAVVARDPEVRRFIDTQALFGKGVGYIDVHLLASVRMTAGAWLWTKDKRLRQVAAGLSIPQIP